MAKATGVNKQIAYKKETTFGVLAGDGGAAQLRRVTASFSPTKETYQSNEIRTDYQIADMRHGVRSATGSVSAELSPGSYARFMESVVARDFAVVSDIAGLEVTIATSGVNFTVTRSAGDYIADGVKVGSVVTLAGAGLNAANVGNNLLVISVTATVLTVKVLSATALVAEGPIAAVTLSYPGKQTFIPVTAGTHTDDSYTVEEWFSDITQSQVYTGVKVGSFGMSLPASGLVTADISLQGADLAQSGGTQYFTSPTAPDTNGILASVQGALLINGTEGACITDASININRTLENANCVGSDSTSDIFTGSITVDGSMSAFFSDGTLRDYFDNETEVTVVLALTSSEAKDADFISFVMPRVKLNSFNTDDSQTGITSSIDFMALVNSNTSTGLVGSTIMIQDSQA